MSFTPPTRKKAAVHRPRISVHRNRPSDTQQSLLSINLDFFNELRDSVTVVTRENARYCIGGNRNRARGSFTIRQAISCQSLVTADYGRTLDESDAVDGGQTTEQLATYVAAPSVNHSFAKQPDLFIDYTLTRDDLVNRGGSIYIARLDILVCLDGYEIPDHPYSELVQLAELGETVSVVAPDKSMVHAVRLVDNAGVIGPRWINLYGQVYPVPIIQNECLRDGVYIVTQSFGEGQDHTQFYPPEELDKVVGLYLSAPDAKTYANPDAHAKRQMDIAKREWEATCAARQREQDAREMELKEREQRYERERQEWAVEKLRMDRDTAITKDQLDQNSTSRKVLLEVTKFLPAIAWGIWGLVKLFDKLKETK